MQEQSYKTSEKPAPPKRVRANRLTDALKNLPINPKAGVKVDFETGRCLRSYADYHGWEIVQERDTDGGTIIWRIG